MITFPPAERSDLCKAGTYEVTYTLSGTDAGTYEVTYTLGGFSPKDATGVELKNKIFQTLKLT
ncbi:hypothetical protein T484DRAFT_1846371, partial [Baffinella frigidus]